MAATKGNEFWKLRSKHGRDKIFESPEVLYDACMEYLEVTSKRYMEEHDFVGKDAHEVYRKKKVPFTLSGLYVFLDIDEKTWSNYRRKYEYKEFFQVIRTIENIIYTQKFEGAASGIFQHNIIARDLGLKDHTENNNNQNFKILNLDPFEAENNNSVEENLEDENED